MTIIIMVTDSLVDNGKRICSLFYYITNFLVIIPLCLRFNRIVKCCEINEEFSLEIQGTNIKKDKYQEKYYIKIMLVIFVALTGVRQLQQNFYICLQLIVNWKQQIV